jgi:hypothetical protein
MQRIDGPTRATALPAPGATGSGGSSPGYFGHGDPLASPPVPYTTLGPDWANMVQEEIIAVILWAGLTLDKANFGQLLEALQTKFVQAVSGDTEDSVLAANGYRRHADGFKECWGTVSVGSGAAVTVNLPITHDSWFNVSLGSPVKNGSGANINSGVQSKTGVASFTLRNWEDTTLSFDWSTRGV